MYTAVTLKYGKVDPNLFIRTNDKLKIEMYEDWNSLADTVVVWGEVIRVTNTNQRKSNYGIEVFGKQITTKDTVLQFSKTFDFNDSTIEVNYNEYINLSQFVNKLIDITVDMSLDFTLQLNVRNNIMYVRFDNTLGWDEKFVSKFNAYKYIG